MFQILAYVINSNFSHNIKGMLLYPTVNKEINANFPILGKSVGIRPLNLNSGSYGFGNWNGYPKSSWITKPDLKRKGKYNSSNQAVDGKVNDEVGQIWVIVR